MTLHPKSRVDYRRLASLHLTEVDVREPTSVKEAIASPKWRIAMEDELQAICKNKTRSLILPNLQDNVVSCRWICRVKKNVDGTLVRTKARLVARGFSQIKGIDVQETFSPIIKFTTICVVLSIVVSNGRHLRQIDINSAFHFSIEHWWKSNHVTTTEICWSSLLMPCLLAPLINLWIVAISKNLVWKTQNFLISL